jgi:hypothetical protein
MVHGELYSSDTFEESPREPGCLLLRSIVGLMGAQLTAFNDAKLWSPSSYLVIRNELRYKKSDLYHKVFKHLAYFVSASTSPLHTMGSSNK